GISQLAEGHSNAIYLVRVGNESIVIRIPPGDRSTFGFQPVNEVENTMAAAAVGVAPRVVEYLADWDVMVWVYVPGETLARSDSERSNRSRGSLASFASSTRPRGSGPTSLGSLPSAAGSANAAT